MKIYLVILLFLLQVSGSVMAQDRIYTVKGKVINGRIKALRPVRVSYRSDIPTDTIIHHIYNHDVDYIQYEDGHIWRPRISKEELAAIRTRRRTRRYAGKSNVLTLNAPVFISFGEYPGIAVGIAYERFLDKKSMFSASLSLRRYWGGTFAGGKLNNNETRANLQGMTFTPGLLYHPGSNNKGSDFSAGIILPVGSIRRHDVNGGQYGYYTTSTLISQDLLLAALGQISITIHSRSAFVFQLQFAAGSILTAGPTKGAMFQFGFGLGGRF